MKLKALVIDDSGVVRNMVMRSLREMGLASFVFVEAENGVDALKKFDPKSTDIVFVDWNMPKMSGFDFVRKVRAKENAERIPIVMITSERSMEKIEEALNYAGVDAYITKPFTVDQLSQKLGQMIKDIARKRSRGSGFFSKLKESIS